MAYELPCRAAMNRSLRFSFLALSLSMFACGGVAESGSPSQTGSPNEETKESTPAPDPSPTTPRAPQKVAEPNAPPNVAVPYQIIVSNQSYDVDPVDIDIFIDGVHVITGDFKVENQHAFIPFDFEIATGEHTLKVVSKRGKAEATATLKINATQRWTVINYWFYEKARGGQGPDEKPHISVDTYDSEPAFG